jgi:hypothetical protein
MKVIINHNNCQHGAAYADHCLAATIRNPLGHEKYCMAQMEEDGKPELTVTLIEANEERTIILHSQAEQDAAASEGWRAFYKSETQPHS